MTLLDRRTLFKAGAAGTGGLLAGAVVGPTASTAAPPSKRRTLARGLSIPWGLAFLPTGNALVAERDSALVHKVSRRGGSKVVGEVEGVVPFGEGGLLGLACHPNFVETRWLYAYITAASDNRVVRMRYVDGRLGSQETVLAGFPKAGNHNGGRLRFGPAGHLFVSTGDAGDTSNAQDVDSLGGKILRVTPDGDVPAGNPFRGSPVWSYGHRNVQGLSFDKRGRLWATEFGQNTRDELNRIVKGHNYGWPVVEGGDGGGGSFHDPLVTWSPTSTCSPSGLAVAGGHAWVGALAGQSLYRVDLRGGGKGTIRRFFRNDFGRIRTVELAPDRTLWITTSNGTRDRVIRIERG
jgi:glucose/arabinose dehydrogenase